MALRRMASTAFFFKEQLSSDVVFDVKVAVSYGDLEMRM